MGTRKIDTRLVFCFLSFTWAPFIGAAAAQTALLVTGRSTVKADGSIGVYNGTLDVGISSLYLDTWNYMNGNTWFWGSTDYTLGDGAVSYRVLIRFQDAHKYIPANTVVQSAELTLTFINWNNPVMVQACFLTKPWNHTQGSAPRFQSTGWRYSGWNGSAPSSWRQAGGWADCSSDVLLQLLVPPDGVYGSVQRTLQLDPGRVAAWLANNGSANYGLLIRSLNGTIGLAGSQWSKDAPLLRRPALSITTSTSTAGATPPPAAYPRTLGAVPRVWWVAPGGDDEAGSGHLELPFRSPARALIQAQPGDKVYLTSGVYPGGFSIERPNITLQSAPGHWAVISLPRTDPRAAANVITLRPGADGGVLRDLELCGGFYYGVMFFSSWENYGSQAERVARGAAPSGWLLENLRIHDTGSSGVKLVMKSARNTLANCEIYNTGARLRLGGHGVEAVQSYDLTVRDCYFHDIPGAAVHLAGGTARALLERNYVARTNFGFNLGFATEFEYMDSISNPALYESINATARNNILTALGQAGINVWASKGAVIAHNTIWQAQESAQSCILVAAYSHDYTPSGPLQTRCWGLTVWANVVVRSATARPGPVVQIREAGLDSGSPLVFGHNVYYDQNGPGPAAFQWGKGAMLEDERATSTFVGNATGWACHCSTTLKQPYCDVNSVEADPLLNPSFGPRTCSPARLRANATLPSGLALVADDFHGRVRPTGRFDAGAVQSDAVGATKTLPPVPAAFANISAVKGIGTIGPVYDKSWPYQFWLSRTCKDLYVDALYGNDNQAFNYDSNYTFPFKTLQKALENINQCDRVLLRGGQSHPGPVGIYRPNVTITTNPADLATKGRATLVCNNTGVTPCVRTGDGFYGGAAALNLFEFDVIMAGTAAGSCIQLNEGSGGGSTAYWSYYLAASGRAATAPKVSYIKNMTLSSCGLHGVKLSTFVRGVTLQGLTIRAPRDTGVEVRGGGDLVISDSSILSPGGTGIRLGGGARNVLVERNLIRSYGDRGILLGSDVTEVAYMDVDWALSQSPQPDWHDSINTTVRNNILDGGSGAGIAFYSALDAVVVHNTLLGVAARMQAGVLLSVSPKQLGPTSETAAPNANITFRNNILTLGGSNNLMIEARVVQGGTVNKQLVVQLPNSTCPAAAVATGRRALAEHQPCQGHHQPRRVLRERLLDATEAGEAAAAGEVDEVVVGSHDEEEEEVEEEEEEVGLHDGAAAPRRQLAGQTFARAYVNAPGEQGRSADGSCPLLPADNAWHQDVSSLPVHPNSEAIKKNIGSGNLHPDFGGGTTVNGQRVLYGIPFITVDSKRGTPLVPVDISPSGYPSESDTSPAGFPIPPDAPVEGAYPNCPEPPCGGDRHVLVLDNATCLLYEMWRSFPPALSSTGRWRADILARFNLSRNALGRPLGWTSADAAGLAILPGLVRWEEVVGRGVIDHAIRFTGPNSRKAYVPPATHFAPAGYQGPDAPPMGLRVRLKAEYDCSQLAPAARVFCTALKKYGGIFADNGSPWYFTGEATAKWDVVLPQLYDISRIPSSALEVLDTGCLCVTADCSLAECNGIPNVDPNALPVYPAVANLSSLSFANNIYSTTSSPPAAAAAAAAGRYVDRRVPPLGPGYDGVLAGWKTYTKGEAGSLEAAPALNGSSYQPLAGSPARKSVPRLAAAAEDYYGRARAPVGNWTDAGAVLG